MKLLLIEDNKETVKGIYDYACDNEWECEICGFEEANDQIALYDPEIIVMDWMFDAEEVDRGADIFYEIYNKRFRPVIIFSAVAETIELPEDIKGTPLIDILGKGDEQDVINRIEQWNPYIKAVNNLHIELNKSLLSSVQAIDNFMKMESYPGDDVVKYMLNKRTTYYFDTEYIGKEPPAWIQYEYPPVQKTLLVADILRLCSEEGNKDSAGLAEEYCVILTPSCDMARAKDGQIILIAECQGADRFSNDAKLSKGEKSGKETYDKKKDGLIRALHTGYNASKVALPQLPNKIPYMTIDLKSIKQATIGEIALSEKEINENTKYYRVASVNSPFREQIVWAHMINSCRPGMPERNMDEWAEGIFRQ